MNNRIYKKAVSILVMLTHVTMATLTPMGQVQAAPLCTSAAALAGTVPQCSVKKFPTQNFAYPKLEWSVVGQLKYTPTSTNTPAMASGDKALVSNNRFAAAIGLPAGQIADAMTLFPTGVPFVFARYNPYSMLLNIEIFKVERVGSAMQMMRAPFSPSHGDAFAAAQIYASPAERTSPGANPFALYRQGTNDSFHNVGSLAATQVAVGHAMRMAGASIGLVAVAEARPHQYVTEKKKWYKKTVTTHLDGYTKPMWYVATPHKFQAAGDTAAICAVAAATPTDCQPYHLAKSGVTWSKWEGGNLPAFETQTSTWEKSKSSYTLLAVVVAVFLVVATGGALAMAVGSTAGALGPVSLIQSALAAPAAAGALTLEAVLATAAVEAGAAAAIGGLSGAHLNDAVAGPYVGARDGFGTPQQATSEAGQKYLDGIRTSFDGAINTMKVKAVNEGLYGTCAEGAPAASCTKGGVVPRPDSGIETNNVQYWLDNGRPMSNQGPLN